MRVLAKVTERILRKMRDRDISAIELRTNRVFSIIAAAAVIGMGFVSVGSYNPWSERIAIGILALIPFILSWFGEFFRKNYDYLLYPLYFALIAWLTRFAYLNSFASEYMVALLLVVVASGLVKFRKFWHFVFFLAYSFLAISLVAYTAIDTVSGIHVFVALVGTGAAVAFLMERTRQQSFQKILDQQEMLEKYFRIIGVMLIILDKDGLVQMANEKAEEVLGYPRKDIIGKDWFQNFVPKEDRDGVMKVFRNLMRGGGNGSASYENRVLIKGGRKKLISWNNSVIKEGGKVVSTISAGQDVTDKKAREEKIRKMNKTMIGREMQMIELKKQIKKLKSSDESKKKK